MASDDGDGIFIMFFAHGVVSRLFSKGHPPEGFQLPTLQVVFSTREAFSPKTRSFTPNARRCLGCLPWLFAMSCSCKDVVARPFFEDEHPHGRAFGELPVDFDMVPLLCWSFRELILRYLTCFP